MDNLPTAPGGHNPYLDYERAKGLVELTERMDQDERYKQWLERERKELGLPTRDDSDAELERENKAVGASPFPRGTEETPPSKW